MLIEILHFAGIILLRNFTKQPARQFALKLQKSTLKSQIVKEKLFCKNFRQEISPEFFSVALVLNHENHFQNYIVAF